MAQPSNTFSSYDAVGNREDLADVIYDVSPHETPLLSMIPKVKATARIHEWQTDSLASPSGTNFVVEGDDATADALTATTRLTNMTGISDKVVITTGTQNAVKTAGRSKEHAYQLVKKGRELKTDIETAIFANNAKVTGTDTQAREVAGMETWYTSNTSAGSGGSDAAGTGADARTPGTQRAFTEDLLLDVHQSAWSNGGMPDCLFVGPFNKRVASGFTGVATKYKDVDDKKIIATADVYVSDFGEVKIIPSRHVAGRSAHLIQKDMWAYATLRDMKTEKLARTGDSEKTQLLCEWTIEARNQASSGLVADLTTS